MRPWGLKVRVGRYGRREWTLERRGGGKKRDRVPHGVGHLRTMNYYFSAINESWPDTPRCTLSAQHHKPSEQGGPFSIQKLPPYMLGHTLLR